MYEVINEEKIDAIYNSLNVKQREFIDQIRASSKDQWKKKFATIKGLATTKEMDCSEIEDSLNDWVLWDILDGGYKNKPYKCECGKSIRYQYIFKKCEHEIDLKLGSTCIHNYFAIDATYLKKLEEGKRIIYEKAREILIKHDADEFANQRYLLSHHELPDSLTKQLSLQLPLTDNQQSRANDIILQYKDIRDKKEHKKRIKKVKDGLSHEQKKYLEELSDSDQYQLVVKLMDGRCIYNINDLKHIEPTDIMKRKVRLQIPFTDEEVERLDELKRKAKNKLRKYELLNYLINKNKTVLNNKSIVNEYQDFIDTIYINESNLPKTMIKDLERLKKLIKESEAGEKISKKTFLLLVRHIGLSMGLQFSVFDR